MSIATNLEKIETDITNAYSAVSTKGGTIPANKNTNNLEAAINSIPSGGGSATSNDVTFYDYDGTIVDSYNASDFANLQAMPQNPTHTGLTAQGWNWSLSDAKIYVANHGKLNIGQMYTTDDEKTRIYIHLEEGRLSPYLGFQADVFGIATIDWGDNTTADTVYGDGGNTIYTQHTYANAGDYVISLSMNKSSKNFRFAGDSTRQSTILSNNLSWINKNSVYQNCIKKIELGSNVRIGEYAFSNCYSLESITIPSTVTSITTNIVNVFADCKSLKSVTIPTSLTSIGNFAFSGCNSLKNISIPNGVTSIGNNFLTDCNSLQSVTIPDTVTSIGSYAFQNCNSLQNIDIPNEVTSIETYAFNSCSSLENIVIPNGVTNIGNYAFQDCYSLESVAIPDTVTNIGNAAFQNCYFLKDIVIPNGVTSINGSTFYGCHSLQSVTIPNGVTNIEMLAFQDCYSLQSVTIPDTVTNIGNKAFQNCYSLENINIPNGLTSIGYNYTFQNCYSLRKITIPNISDFYCQYMFENCYSLISIVFPSDIKYILTNAFQNCYGMSYYDFTACTVVPPLTNTNAFTGIPDDCKIIVPDNLYDTWVAATNWSNYASYIVRESDYNV